MKVEKLWGGRFEHLPSREIIEFLSGRDVKGIPPCDERLIPYDLWGVEPMSLCCVARRSFLFRTGKESSGTKRD